MEKIDGCSGDIYKMISKSRGISVIYENVGESPQNKAVKSEEHKDDIARRKACQSESTLT